MPTPCRVQLRGAIPSNRPRPCTPDKDPHRSISMRVRDSNALLSGEVRHERRSSLSRLIIQRRPAGLGRRKRLIIQPLIWSIRNDGYGKVRHILINLLSNGWIKSANRVFIFDSVSVDLPGGHASPFWAGVELATREEKRSSTVGLYGQIFNKKALFQIQRYSLRPTAHCLEWSRRDENTLAVWQTARKCFCRLKIRGFALNLIVF